MYDSSFEVFLNAGGSHFFRVGIMTVLVVLRRDGSARTLF